MGKFTHYNTIVFTRGGKVLLKKTNTITEAVAWLLNKGIVNTSGRVHRAFFEAFIRRNDWEVTSMEFKWFGYTSSLNYDLERIIGMIEEMKARRIPLQEVKELVE